MKKIICGLFFLATMIVAGTYSAEALAQAPDDLLIIVHKDVDESSMSVAEAKSIFLKKKINFKSGAPASPINSNKGTPLRIAFLAKVIGMDQAEENRYWEDEKVRKGTIAPIEIMNTLKAVAHTKGGIGYVFRKDFKDGQAKIIATF